MTFNENIFYTLLKEMIHVKAPSLEEYPRTKIIKNFLTKSDIPHRLDSAGNVIIELNPGKKQETIIFDAHIDIAGKGYSNNLSITEDFITGQGCADDLAAAVMLLVFAHEIDKTVLKKPLTILLSTGEEGKGNLFGIKTFVADFKSVPHAFISLDLSFDTISFKGLGSKRFAAHIKTQGGHSFEDYGNPNAVELMCRLICNIKDKINQIKFEKRPTFNAGSIKGGNQINQIADSCSAEFEFRSVSQDSLEKAENIVKQAISAAENHNVNISFEDIGSRPGAEPVEKEKLENIVLPVFKKNNISPVEKAMSTNINATLNSKWPSLCTGICECGKFHTEEEYIKKDSLKQGWNLLIGLMSEFGII